MKKRKRVSEKPDVKKNLGDIHVGEVVVSVAGRDAGFLLVIIAGSDDGYVLVADGKTRKLMTPKRKKMRHLSKLTRLSEEETERLRAGTVKDSELHGLLTALDLEALT